MAATRYHDPVRFAYQPPTLLSGPGCVGELDTELERHGLERALVVTGSTVGETEAVMEPVRSGLGPRLLEVLDVTTPKKRLATAAAVADRARTLDADVLVGVGGGSSLDVTTVASMLAVDGRDATAAGEELEDTNTISLPDADPLPVVAVPTTLAGADLSMMAGITAHPDGGLVGEPTGGGVSGQALMPLAVAMDPELVATTPHRVLAASAMNGFDKGIETLYSQAATPVTDATATHGLSLLRHSLPALDDGDLETVGAVTDGILLVQYGISRASGSTLSLIHAFGHGLTRAFPIQQGAAHAVVAPHALATLFDRVDGRRALLADALGKPSTADPAAAVVDEVRAVRDGMGLPGRLRDLEGTSTERFEDIATWVLADSLMANTPPGLDLDHEEVVAVLEAAW